MTTTLETTAFVERWTDTRDGSQFDPGGLPEWIADRIRDHIKVWNTLTALELVEWFEMSPEDHWAFCEARLAELEAADRVDSSINAEVSA